MTWRRGAFLLAGCAVVAAALSPPLDAAADKSLPLHMVQHMLLLAVAPPLLILGEPIRVAFDLLPPRGARRLADWLRSRPLQALLNPLVALGVFALVVLATHLPAVFDPAMESDPLHALEHGAYLGAGLLFWATALSADPAAKPLSLVAVTGLLTAAMVPMIAVGVALNTATGVFYSPYAAGTTAAAAIAEQDSGATAMWAGDLPFAAALVLAGWAALKREERLQRLHEMAAERESVKTPLEEDFSQTRRGGVV
ncbi:MAG: cytochrome c oxidase assembly protein [Solirubrobacterales bacterium]